MNIAPSVVAIKQVNVAAEVAQRVRNLLKQRDKAEAEVAAILRGQLDSLGEAKWLGWCEKEFGWARSTAYRHLNPAQMEKKREQDRERMSPTRRHTQEQDNAPDAVDSGVEYTAEDARTGERAAAERGWYNRAREAAQYARYAPADTCPVNKATIEAIEDAIEAWSSVLNNVNRRKDIG